MTKKILVLGSNSFAGSNFIDYCLFKRCKIYAISRSSENNVFLKYKKNPYLKNLSFFKKDVNLSKDRNFILRIIKKNDISHIINFAAQGMVEESWFSPEDWYKTNFTSQILLINQIIKLKTIKKYINFSTPEVYGSTKRFFKESYSFNPSTPYALSRASFDLHLKLLNKNYNFPMIITRTANIYGPYQQLYRIIPKSIISFLKKKKINLHGGGNSIRSFIFMNDVSEALYKILLRGKIGDTYHISTNRFVSIKDLVIKIQKKLNKSKLINFKSNERIGKDYAYKLNSLKLRKKMKWKPKTSLDDGINETIDWVKLNFNYFKKLNLEYKHKK